MKVYGSILVLILLLTGLSEAGQTGEWLQLRGDRHMSGRATGVGQIGSEGPVEAWRYDIAAWEGYLVLAQGEPNRQVELPFSRQVDPAYIGSHQQAWGIGPQLFDLANNGARVVMGVNNTFKVAKILPRVPGLQRFEMEDSFSDGGAEPKLGRLLAYDTGVPRVVWETEAFTDIWSPNVLVVDADADGQLDIVVATHYRILVFDGASGITKMQLPYHNYRNYGWFGAANIDADPYPEFAVVADFSMHAEVIDNDGMALTVNWLRHIQPDPSQSTKIVRPKPQALLDVDGDGAIEVIYNIYNDTGDGQWHIVVVDARSGQTRYDFSPYYLHGLADVDADKQVELFVAATAGEALPAVAPLELWTLTGTEPTVRWHQADGRFSSQVLEHLPLTVSSSAADGLRTVVTGDIDVDGRLDFFVITAGNTGPVLTAYGVHSTGQIGVKWAVQAPQGMELEIAAVAAFDGGTEAEALLYLKGQNIADQALIFSEVGATLRQWSRQAFTPAGTPVVTDLDGNGSIEVIVQTGTKDIICLEAPETFDQRPQLRWQMPGYGQTNNAPFHWGVVAADLNQDGTKVVLMASEAASGNASLTAVDAAGKVHWQSEFIGFDGNMPIWNLSGLSYWNVGHFRSTAHQDVFATLRRGKLGSEIGFLLDGRNGEILWESAGFTLPEDGSGRSLGGHPSAVGDLDGDSLEEIVLMWPDRLYLIDGLTATPRAVRQSYGYTAGLNPLFTGSEFIGYAFPAVVDLFGDARPELIWGHCGYLNAVLDASGNRIWQTAYKNNTAVQSLMGVGDLDGDGRMELLASTVEGVKVFRPQDGTVLLTLDNVGEAHTDIVSGDLDNDGRDEFLFASGNQLICIEQEMGKLRQAWSIDVEARSSDIALADVNGDNGLDIAVTTSSGYLKVYASAAMQTAVTTATAGPILSRLKMPYPNPFNNALQVDFSMAQTGLVQVDVFNLAGQRVTSLMNAWQTLGDYRLEWNATNVASGVYIIRLRVGDVLLERKVLMIK